jgi:Uma2 family endonuclease
VDPFAGEVRVYRREGSGFGKPKELSRRAGDVLRTPLLAGLDLPLERVFRDTQP